MTETHLIIITLIVAIGAFIFMKVRYDINISQIQDKHIEELDRASARVEELKKELEELKGSFDSRLKTAVDYEREKIQTTMDAEFKEAVDEQAAELGEKIVEIDKGIEEAIADLKARNTLYFTCTCDKEHRIPVSMDFTTENKFSCEKCGSVYRVEFNAYPVLLSNVSNNKVIANIFKEGGER